MRTKHFFLLSAIAAVLLPALASYAAKPVEFSTAQLDELWAEFWKSGDPKTIQEPMVEKLSEREVIERMTGKWLCARFGDLWVYVQHTSTNIITPDLAQSMASGLIDLNSKRKVAANDTEGNVDGPTDDAKATKHFQEYLAKCGTNEIRCVWFLNEKPNVAMVMTLNLQAYSVYTVREVYNWALQSEETRKLSHSQVLSLQKISGELPPSDKTVEFGKAVSVSIRKGDKVEVFKYDRKRAPTVIQRIYDIGGGYFYNSKD
ncbi:MAG: hypothetical protein HY298_19080 [Verrucomicrobia bacterium]|nr:hypothetical protein [Verrucomicrobiota bacterium]